MTHNKHLLSDVWAPMRLCSSLCSSLGPGVNLTVTEVSGLGQGVEVVSLWLE